MAGGHSSTSRHFEGCPHLQCPQLQVLRRAECPSAGWPCTLQGVWQLQRLQGAVLVIRLYINYIGQYQAL